MLCLFGNDESPPCVGSYNWEVLLWHQFCIQRTVCLQMRLIFPAAGYEDCSTDAVCLCPLVVITGTSFFSARLETGSEHKQPRKLEYFTVPLTELCWIVLHLISLQLFAEQNWQIEVWDACCFEMGWSVLYHLFSLSLNVIVCWFFSCLLP